MISFIEKILVLLKKYWLFLLIITVVFIGYQFMFFGTANIKIVGQNKDQVVKLSVYDSSNELIKSFTNNTSGLRLKKGNYLVVATVIKGQGSRGDNPLSLREQFNIKNRKNTDIMIKLSGDTDFKKYEINLKQNFFVDSYNKNGLIFTDSVGGIYRRTFDSKGLSADNMFLTTGLNLVGVCGMSNGNVIMSDRFGKYYLKNSSEKKEVDIRSISYGKNGIIPDNYFYNSGHLHSNSNFICGDNYLIVNNKILIDENGKVSVANPDLGKANDVNSFYLGSGDGLVLFNRFDIDDQDHDGEEKDNTSNVYFFDDKFKLIQNVTVKDVLESFSFINQRLFCYSSYSSNIIKCSNDGGNSYFMEKKASFLNDPPGSVSNLHFINEDELVYSTPNSVWVLNLKTLNTGEIFNSNFTLNPNSITFDIKNRSSFSLTSYNGGTLDAKSYKAIVFNKN